MDWQARARINGEIAVIAEGTATSIETTALAELERRNITACRLWQSIDGKWIDAGKALWNTQYDRTSPSRD